jgi:hypothetical protein
MGAQEEKRRRTSEDEVPDDVFSDRLGRSLGSQQDGETQELAEEAWPQAEAGVYDESLIFADTSVDDADTEDECDPCH